MSQPAEPAIYRITVQGHLDEDWTLWFEGLVLSHDQNGSTTLTGPVADQSALLGILVRLGDLNLTLASVIRIEARSNG
jgi:hypothetical protein